MKNKFLEKYNYFYNDNNIFILTLKELKNDERTKILNAIESLLLEDTKIENTAGYLYLESLKNNKEFLNKYKKALNKHNRIEELYLKLNLKRSVPNCFDIYRLLYLHIDEQTTDLINKQKKLDVIDEFARVSRYSNDGKIWTSGVHLNFIDINNNISNWSSLLNSKEKNRKVDTGVLNNNFINYFSNDYYLGNDNKLIILNEGVKFTEEEKQNIFLIYNDVMAYNRMILCNDTAKIDRPDFTHPCQQEFILKKEEIYKDEQENYLVICPNCGCINYLEKETLDRETIDYIEKNHDDLNHIIKYKESEIKILKMKKSK